MKRLIFSGIALMLLTGCQKQLESFINGVGDINRSPGSVTNPFTTDSGAALKVSGGHVSANGTNVSMRATISPTSRLLTGTNISARVSISQSRYSQ